MKRSLLLGAAVAAGSLWGATCTFTDGAWDVAPSGETDDIVIASGALTWDAALPAKVASWTQTGGTVTFQTAFPGQGDFQLFEVTGDVSLTGGTWTHTGNSSTEKYRLNVACGGNFTVGEKAEIDVTARGYSNAGPGRVSTHCGGGYGGQGSGYQDKPVTPCYGSITKPVNLGTSGNSTNHKGGGAVRLVVAGALTVNGRIFAEGQTQNPLNAWYGGAGGSIWVAAASLVGAGEISASASRIGNNYNGGGGRIALYLTGAEANFTGFTGHVYAYPTRDSSLAVKDSAAGTVYYETAADDEGKGRLVIDRGATNGALASSAATDIILDDQDETFSPSEIVLMNGATMLVTSGTRMSLAIGAKLTLAGGSKVVLKGSTLDLTAATIEKTGTGTGTIQLSSGMIVADALSLPSAVNVQVTGDGTIDATSVSVENGATVTIDTPLAVTGNLTVRDGGKVTHSSNTKDTSYRMTLTVAGNLTVDAGGKIDVSNKGYAYLLGPGSSKSMYGSCHGGRSYYQSESQIDETAVCYGSLIYPMEWGSGLKQVNQPAQSDGGGAMRLTVTGTLTVNGEIVAYGCQNSTYYSSAGGSIWITAGSLAGTESSAVISASTGVRTKKYYYNLSGGGRVAIHLMNPGAGFDGYAGSITAYGTMMDTKNAFTAGGAGTVYLKTGDQEANEGTLVIDNGLPEGKTGGVTEISASVLDTEVGNVVVRNGGRLKILADQRLTVRGDWDAPSEALVSETNAGLVFAGSGTSHVYSNLTVSAFVCQTPDKEIVFGDGTTLTITAGGLFLVEGESDHPVVLRSETPATVWNLAVDATVAQSVNQASVADCDASAGAQVSAVNSTLSNTTNWKNTTVVVGQTVTWTGAAGSSSWMTAGNWDVERAPLATDRIVIAPANVSPVLNDDFTSMDLTVQTGAALDLNGKTFTTTGDLSVHGTITTVRGGKVVAKGGVDFTDATVDTPWLSLVLAGDGAAVQTLAGGGCAFDSVTVAPNAAGVAVTGGFTAWTLACTAERAFALSFAPGVTVAVEAMLSLNGPIALGSTVAGQAWNMSVNGVKDVNGVTVSDCSAALLTIPAVWTGAVSSDFNTPGNWSTGAVPGAEDDVIIGAGTVKASAAISVGSLWLKDGAIATLDNGVSVAKTVYVSSGATLTHSANASTESNRLILDMGANFAVEAGAAIDVTGKGYAATYGPGGCVRGGNHAGRGEAHDNALDGKTYGSALWPVKLGSGGNYTAGGGAVQLTVAGVARIDGTIAANGANSENYYSGAGGSIAIRAAAVLGGGSIAANGGDVGTDYTGSGGRIAIVLTGAGETLDRFTGRLEAYSGKMSKEAVPYPRGSAGTIYVETSADGAGRGVVVVDNSPQGAARHTTDPKLGVPRTDYPVMNDASVERNESKHATWILRNTVGLNITADAKIGALVVEGTKPKVYLNGHTLKINTDRPADWPKDGTLPSFVVPGADAEGNPGRIVWRQGVMVFVR